LYVSIKMNSGFMIVISCHCEERSDEAISLLQKTASLGLDMAAMVE
jgi:hypothetical protein